MMYQFWSTLIGVVLILSVVIVVGYVHQQSSRKKQQMGISHIKDLRLILAMLQKHRGLSSTYIKGEQGLKKDIVAIQQEANHRIRSLLHHHQDMQNNELCLSILDHWARLSANYVNNNVENNVIQHNAMIQNLLYLIDDVAISHELTGLKLEDIGNVRLIWKEWLTAIECIGQARAMGSAILAEGRCNSVARIRLSYLQEKISVTAEQAWRGIPVSEMQKQQLAKVVNCIKNDIIDSSLSNTINMASAEYFALCSEVMDSYYQQFDQLIEQL